MGPENREKKVVVKDVIKNLNYYFFFKYINMSDL